MRNTSRFPCQTHNRLDLDWLAVLASDFSPTGWGIETRHLQEHLPIGKSVSLGSRMEALSHPTSPRSAIARDIGIELLAGIKHRMVIVVGLADRLDRVRFGTVSTPQATGCLSESAS